MNKIHSFVVLAYGESPYLEKCIKSVTKNNDSEVMIATTTPNAYISNLAKKYKINVFEGKHTNIGGDFDFALNCTKTPLVTIAHQDDIYDLDYAKKTIEAYKTNLEASIIFTDYYEIRNEEKIETNINLKIKRCLLLPIKITGKLKNVWAKRNILRFGCAICCPAVTFVKENCPSKVFTSNFQCNVDWNAWEKLSKKSGQFVFVDQKLMGHRISNDSTTTDSIKNGIRAREDLVMYGKFWPKWVAKVLVKFYGNSEKSNSINNS